MKQAVYFIPIVIILLMNASWISAQEKYQKKPYTLTHHMSPEEKAMFHLVGKGYEETDPPPGIVHNIAEFEKMEGVLVGYPGNFGISYNLITALSQVTTVTTIVETNSQLNYVTNQYQNQGVNMSNTNFLVTALDSYWTRDYGPWFVRYGDHQIGIVDFIYNRPNRPNDNAVPPQIAGFLGIEWFGMDLITAGGNYMTDGYGISSSSELVWEENPTLSPTDIDQMVLDYLGVYEYHVVPDPNNTYIDHIDCWGKFLDVDKVLIREVPASHPQYDEIEANASYFASQVSAWGNNYQVYRVWTPNNEPYTNSLILNQTVFLPIMGGQWDDEAVASYEEAMPGYQILTFTGSWESTDALHCRTIGLADRNTLYIEHFPLLGNQPVQTEYEIEAKVIPYSGYAVNNNEVRLKYRINDVVQDDIIMTYLGNEIYSAIIPVGVAGSKIEYYLTATDLGGFTANHPFIGEPDPHVFFAGEQLFPEMTLNVSEINAWVNQGYIDVEEFIISNTGQFMLNYSLDWSSAVMQDFDYEVENSPMQYAWDDNTYTELGWTEIEVNNVVGTIGNWTISFTWNTDNWPEEGTFHALSPQGTEAIIVSGISDGTYTIELDAFDGEQMSGTWRLWITDSYGDGGHQATDISLTITKTFTIFPWLSVQPTAGTIQPGESQVIHVSCDGTVMPLGNYTGHIFINSTDPENPYVDLPVYFTVDYASGVAEEPRNLVNLTTFPNPFSNEITIDFSLIGEALVSIQIFYANGQIVKNLLERRPVQGKFDVSWNGLTESGNPAKNGIYYYRILIGNDQVTGKIILRK